MSSQADGLSNLILALRAAGLPAPDAGTLLRIYRAALLDLGVETADSEDLALEDGEKDVAWNLRVTGSLVRDRLRQLEAELGAEEELDEAAAAAADPEACPGCGCRPGDGRTAGCHHLDGCGYWETVNA